MRNVEKEASIESGVMWELRKREQSKVRETECELLEEHHTQGSIVSRSICFHSKIDLSERDGFHVNTFTYSEYNNCVHVVPTLVREANNEK